MPDQPPSQTLRERKELKTWPEYFRALESGAKTFEVRLNDRAFEVGDLLHLREYDLDIEQYTGRTLDRVVTYVLHGGAFGLGHGYVVMGLAALATQEASPKAHGQQRTCDAVHPDTGAQCELPLDHEENHRGSFRHGVCQWPYTCDDLTPVAEASPQPNLALQPIAPEWIDAVNSAKGLCESEANRWERQNPGTSDHWRSVALRLGALWLTGDHLGTEAQPDLAREQERDIKKAWRRNGY